MKHGIGRITQEVHNQLVLLPCYGVFDNLAYRVSPDGAVTVLRQVVRPTLIRAINSNQALQEYGLRAVPAIHITVNNGHMTLVGVVARQMDKQIAEMQAKSVPNVFLVTRDLQVEPRG
jgi:hyperosmotically inducible protein